MLFFSPAVPLERPLSGFVRNARHAAKRFDTSARLHLNLLDNIYFLQPFAKWRKVISFYPEHKLLFIICNGSLISSPCCPLPWAVNNRPPLRSSSRSPSWVVPMLSNSHTVSLQVEKKAFFLCENINRPITKKKNTTQFGVKEDATMLESLFCKS